MKTEIDWKGIAHCWETLVKENQRQAEILRILKKYPENGIPLKELLRFDRYLKNRDIKITNGLLKAHYIPFDVYEFTTIIEWLEENEE